VTATVAPIKYRVNVNTMEHLAAKKLDLNDIGICGLELSSAIAFEPYRDSRVLGGFILIDRLTNNTVGAGLLHFALRRSQNVHWQALDVNKRARAQMSHQKPCILWFTGLSGAGKSTTLAAMLDKINSEREEHMITIEDPIEFLHNHKKCLVNQREVHADTHSFSNSLRAALREDPDVVLIGEMRDLETIESALRIAETGHLTFATLHTNSASSTINRIIDVFPSHQQPQIRAQLSMVVEGILCQALLPRSDGRGRAMVMEVLIPTPAIRNLIREDKIHQIYSAMQTGTGQTGMQTFNQGLANAYFQKLITLDMALSRSSNPDELQDMINRGVSSPAGGLKTPVASKR